MSDASFTNLIFQQHLDEHKLTASRCQHCGALFLPPHPLCTQCYSEDMAWEPLSGRGTLVAFTVVHIAPTAMIEAGYGRNNPYVAGIVQLEEGPSISAQITGVDPARPESIHIGSAVRVAFLERNHGSRHTALAFEVIDE